MKGFGGRRKLTCAIIYARTDILINSTVTPRSLAIEGITGKKICQKGRPGKIWSAFGPEGVSFLAGIRLPSRVCEIREQGTGDQRPQRDRNAKKATA